MRFDFRNFAAVDAGSSLFPRDRSVSPTMAPHSMASPSRVMILGVRRWGPCQNCIAPRRETSGIVRNRECRMPGNSHDRLEILRVVTASKDGRR